MITKHAEIHTFSKNDLEGLAKQTAILHIINGRLFLGSFHQQIIRWTEDGLEVVTKYERCDWDDERKGE